MAHLSVEDFGRDDALRVHGAPKELRSEAFEELLGVSELLDTHIGVESNVDEAKNGRENNLRWQRRRGDRRMDFIGGTEGCTWVEAGGIEGDSGGVAPESGKFSD